MDHDAHQHLIDAAGRTTAAIGDDEDGEMQALDKDDLAFFARAAAIVAVVVAGLSFVLKLPG